MVTAKKVAPKEVEATPLADPAVVQQLLWDAKALFDMGKFSTLYQADFFAAMLEEVGEPPPPPEQLSVISATLEVTEDSDKKD